MVSRIRKIFDHASLEQKLMALVSSILCLTLGTVLLLGFHFINRQYTETVYQSMAASSRLISVSLETHLHDALQLTDVIRTDSSLQRHLDLIHKNGDYLTAGSRETIYKTLQSLYQQHKQPYLVYSAIINPRFLTYTYGYGYDKLSEALISQILDTADAAHGSPVWIPDQSGRYLFLARQIRKIDQLELSDLGTLVIAVDMNVLLEELTQETKNFQNIFWYICKNDQDFYSAPQLDETVLEQVRHQTGAYHTIITHGHSYLVLKGSLKSLKWDYFQLLPYDAITRSRHYVFRIYVIAIVAGVALTIFLIHLSIRRITHHISILCQKMASFHGDSSQIIQTPYDYSKRTDEIGQLNHYFDSMASEIESLINNDYKLKLDLKNMQLKALESQINPHFLYNTLDSIHWRAMAGGNEEISIMVESLGTLLRASLSQKHSLVPLKEELELVHRYLLIQKIRYEERLLCAFLINGQPVSLPDLEKEIPLEENLGKILIPPFTIQPLVENSIKYGLEQFPEECSIIIELSADQDHLLIQVKNNGSIFEEDLLEHLEHSESRAHGLGIGLLNINQRIRLLFGPEHGLSLYNENGFAIASIRIPITYHEEAPIC